MHKEKVPSTLILLEHGLPEEFVHAIGELIANFAQLEWSIKFGIQTLLTCNQVQKGIITADQDFLRLLEMLRSLYFHATNKRVPLQQVEALCDAAEEVRKYRNKLLHSTLTKIDNENIETKKTTIRTRGKGVQQKWEELNLDELKRRSNKIQSISGEITGIFMGYHDISPPVM